MRGDPARAGAWLAVAAALLAPAIGGAAGPALVAIGPVDEARPALVRQLRQALCAAVECVPWGTVSDGRTLDLARVRSAGIDGVLIGAVEGRGPRRAVRLSLFVNSAVPAARWRVALRADGTVAKRALGGLVHDLERRLAALARGRPDPARPEVAAGARAPPVQELEDGPEPLAPRPPPRLDGAAPTAPLERGPEPAPARGSAPTSGAAEPVAPAGFADDDEALAPLAPRREGLAILPADPEPPARAPWLAVEASSAVARRQLSFQGAAPSPGPLRGQRVPALIAPGLRLEVQPAAWWTDGPLAGISLQVGYATAVGVETTAGGAAHPTRMSWLSSGVAWRSAPLAGGRRSFSVGASWERRDVTVTPRIPGLADRRLSGVKASAGWTQPLGRTSLFAGAGYVRWLDAPELVGGRARFFPGGSAWGLDAEAGVRVRLRGPWSLQLAVEYATTRYRLARDPEGIYVARSARDDLLASRLSLRVEL